jgi:hypothetical protein
MEPRDRIRRLARLALLAAGPLLAPAPPSFGQG